MNLSQQLATAKAQLERNLPADQLATMQAAAADLQQIDFAQRSVPVGEPMPDFALLSATGDRVELRQLIATGPAVISFYRGSWCAFCSLELQALEDALPAIAELGATLVSIAPELPKRARHLASELGLTQWLLHDRGNQLARQLGLTFLTRCRSRCSTCIKTLESHYPSSTATTLASFLCPPRSSSRLTGGLPTVSSILTTPSVSIRWRSSAFSSACSNQLLSPLQARAPDRASADGRWRYAGRTPAFPGTHRGGV